MSLSGHHFTTDNNFWNMPLMYVYENSGHWITIRSGIICMIAVYLCLYVITDLICSIDVQQHRTFVVDIFNLDNSWTPVPKAVGLELKVNYCCVPVRLLLLQGGDSTCHSNSFNRLHNVMHLQQQQKPAKWTACLSVTREWTAESLWWCAHRLRGRFDSWTAIIDGC